MSKSQLEEPQISIILPTYNESKTILNILKGIRESLPKEIFAETIVVDDNSPDGTGKIVEDYIKNFKKIANHTIDVIHRKTKSGLSSAVLISCLLILRGRMAMASRRLATPGPGAVVS